MQAQYVHGKPEENLRNFTADKASSRSKGTMKIALASSRPNQTGEPGQIQTTSEKFSFYTKDRKKQCVPARSICYSTILKPINRSLMYQSDVSKLLTKGHRSSHDVQQQQKMDAG